MKSPKELQINNKSNVILFVDVKNQLENQDEFSKTKVSQTDKEVTNNSISNTKSGKFKSSAFEIWELVKRTN